MAKLSIVAGATSQSVNIFIQDSSSTTGAGLTGLVFNSSGLTAYYSFAGANATATSITLATLAAVNSAYSSGGFKELDATNMPGWYRFDIPDAALAASKGRSVGIHFKGATNMAPLPLEIELTGWDNQDAVHGGMSALPNAAAAAAGGLYTRGSGAGQINQAVNGTVDVNLVDIAGSAVATSSAQLGVNLVNIAGSAVSTSTAQLGVNVVQAAATAWNSGAIARATFAAETGLQSARSNTAQAGGATTITLDASASATNSFYNGMLVVLTGGTGVGQAAVITGYVGATKVATVDHAWQTNPDNTTTFAVLSTDLAKTDSSQQVTAASVQGNVTGSVASVTGAVGSVTGAVGSVTGNVGGNVVGSVASVSGAVGSVTGNVGGNVVGSVGSISGITFPTNFGSFSIDASGNVKILAGLKKNTALAKFAYLMTDSTNHAPATGKTVTCTRSIDGAAYAAGTLANVAELSNGIYLVDFGAGDLNGNVITLRATAAGCDDTFERIVTFA